MLDNNCKELNWVIPIVFNNFDIVCKYNIIVFKIHIVVVSTSVVLQVTMFDVYLFYHFKLITVYRITVVDLHSCTIPICKCTA